MDPLIEAKSITREHHGNAVVRDVSFTINSGECVVIVGPSGAGKSTVLRCLAGLDDLADGEVVFRGTSYVTSSGVQRNLRGDIGMVFQQFNLFPHLTSLENVMLAPNRVRRAGSAQAKSKAEELLRKVGLGDRMGYYPEELSGGQQQRVAIARALAMKPSLMLFDEPTSSLDPEYTREVLEVMKAVISSGMTVALVTHEMGFARQMADKVLFMDDGALVEEGPAHEFFTAPRTDRAMKFLEQIGAEA
ncbi:amino acid ABC transporter ATP-binding protein [Arthrobacter sp. MW3 TE3886]|uniref:amino acid ABC transporter ATP-binding protein n=1 Tax=Arthrobacter sp. MW3 TE3886 TaxID=3156254 RepID=UPI003519792D